MTKRRLWTSCGIAGMSAVVCYILAVTIPWPETQLGLSLSLIVVSAWPVLSIVYSWGLYDCVAAEAQSPANRLGFVFAVAAFSTVLAMIIVQLAVGAGLREITVGLDPEIERALRRGLRLVDQGLDVAWDILIGVALILSGAAIRARKGLGPGWGLPSIVLGMALIGLNAATFPWPPATRGLFDIGPFIALFVLALAGRLTALGRRATV